MKRLFDQKGRITIYSISIILVIAALLLLQPAESQQKPPKEEGTCKCPIDNWHDNDCKDKKTKAECIQNFCSQAMYCGGSEPGDDDKGKSKYRCEWHVPCVKCEDLAAYKSKAKDGWFITADCPSESNACESKVCNIAKDNDGDGKSDETDSISCETKGK